jgi:hypothetical protein
MTGFDDNAYHPSPMGEVSGPEKEEAFRATSLADRFTFSSTYTMPRREIASLAHTCAVLPCALP